MGKYMRDEVEKAQNDEGHYRFVAKLSWTGDLDKTTQYGLDHFLDAVGDEENKHKHTGIQKATLQGYYLRQYATGTPPKPQHFVIIGLQHPKREHSKFGLEEFCSKLIFDTIISGAFYQTVEANDLKNVHGPKKTD
jgi:hypothetical protein